ncbi:uncharacterized protein LOC128988200 [Macrosteles quadrilineatus]|uniref:uncharacterized protein LOC128988200 n=1 Tax=Macrosteles quadrilineatus TaxID=74068 RepID=UPI0023E0FE66|nr:uncharacterized protein LOC128988200 [Macrosteles quadrilineatus]
MVVYTVCMILLTYVYIADSFGPKVGPYDLEIIKFENCEDEGSKKFVLGTRITNAGKGKYIYKESVKFGVPVDGKFKVLLEAQRWGNGGWRPKAFEHKLNNCEDIMKVAGDTVKGFMKSAGVNVEKCPIPAGSYQSDWLIETDLSRAFPAMEYGKYRVILKFYSKDEYVGCFTAQIEVKPKSFG